MIVPTGQTIDHSGLSADSFNLLITTYAVHSDLQFPYSLLQTAYCRLSTLAFRLHVLMCCYLDIQGSAWSVQVEQTQADSNTPSILGKENIQLL